MNENLKLEQQICFPVYSVSRLITKAYIPFLKEMSLTYPQYLVLLVLWEYETLSVNSIGEKLLLNTNTISPLIQRMEKAGLLKRERSTQDERMVMVKLTSKGKELKKKASPIPEKLLKTLLTDDVQLADVILVKDMMNKWIEILSENNKKNQKKD
ncbi:DNA-binding MarR family transcriptional regulator [Christiangramia gaetbulicola]|uniref:HTH-type transcriptional regulator SarZ n=1 Tax=Christiangramia gaetbulicola TaxID=703340 RepID=A0A2T6AI94_9FLAO|nr:MarR family transcriptional regulator [Christiangramia gaetbulicola]PTX43507.1 DNA-binding MarR family transcriptional regulator [Christiangramia gaetbulicola]